ncbi:hypothetical protein V8B55DRAFT_1593150 [Mucor lusitanicus]
MRIWYHPERKVEYRPVFAQFPYETRILHVHPDGRIVNSYTNNDLNTVMNHAIMSVPESRIMQPSSNYVKCNHFGVQEVCALTQPVNLVEDDEFVSIGINKYSAIQRGITIVNEIPVPLGYPKVFIFDKKSRRNIHVQVHKLMANTFLHDDFTEERNIIDHINSDKNKNRLSNLRIVTTAKNNLFSHGVFVLAIDKRTKEETLFPSINHCAAAFFSLYPNLRSYLQRHLEYETVTHLFYRDLPAKYRRGEKFYVDTE